MNRKQIYNWKWQKLSRRFLKKNRHCRFCGRPAIAADHIIPVRIAPHRRFDESNLQALCQDCHSRITTAYERGRLTGACDEAGAPLDPYHPWNQADNTAAITVANLMPESRLVAPEYAAGLKRRVSNGRRKA